MGLVGDRAATTSQGQSEQPEPTTDQPAGHRTTRGSASSAGRDRFADRRASGRSGRGPRRCPSTGSGTRAETGSGNERKGSGNERTGPGNERTGSGHAYRHRRTPAVARSAGGGQGTTPLHLDPAQPERACRRDPGRRADAGHGRSRSPGQLRQGRQCRLLHEALIEVLGADLRIETMVDPSVSGPPAAQATPPSSLEEPTTAPDAARIGAESRERARQDIRPTRHGQSSAAADVDDRDAMAHPDDADVDRDGESHTELLARQLGAQVIAEEDAG